ncbi:MAG: hypothetical protein IJD81_09065 [Oscillospiraceae bacterium]|nr:hypothetical protein [Oscillospiraceae bacterium]
MEPNEQEYAEEQYVNPGQQWAQRLGVVGGLVVLLFSFVFVLTMLTAGPEKLDYEPAHDTVYYEQHLTVLQTELDEHVFPYVEGVQFCEEADGKLVIGIREKYYLDTRAVIIDLFDQTLFVFEIE